MPSVKSVVVGDGGLGKTSLLQYYTTHSFPTECPPTVFERYDVRLTLDGEEIDLQLLDTAGPHDYRRLRIRSYPQTDVFIVCFSVVSPASLWRVEDYWIPEIREHCPDTPCILVGLKCDQRPIVAADPDEWRISGIEAVPSSSGSAMRRIMCAQSYVECSAKMNINVGEVFERAVRVARADRLPRQRLTESREAAAGSTVQPWKKLPSFL
jgi:small GTP-binding protein